MFLKLTTVKFLGEGKNQKSLILQARINFDFVECYIEAPEDLRNHKSENARASTLVCINAANNLVYHVKETVEEIDDMVAAYGSDCEEALESGIEPSKNNDWN